VSEDRTTADVLVVGAGPAGSTAAEHAALKGLEVLLIERKQEVGVPVACGEFLPTAREVERIFPRAEDVDTLLRVPGDLVALETSKLRLYDPKLRVYEIDFEGFTTFRDRFDKYLVVKAERAGARLVTDCAFFSLEDGVARTSKGSIEAKVIIGADGPLSRVAASLDLPKNKDLCPALTAHAEGDFDPVPEMYFGGIAPGGYAWVLPKRHGANVGVGVSPRLASAKVGKYFKNFTEGRKMKTGKPAGKYVPMGGPVRPNFAGKGLIVGDAAGHVIPVNGGGIPIALICGRIAGEVAANHVLSGAPLSLYADGCRRQVEGPLHTALRTKALADLVWGSQWRLGVAMKLLGRRRMGNIIRCKSVLP